MMGPAMEGEEHGVVAQPGDGAPLALLLQLLMEGGSRGQ